MTCIISPNVPRILFCACWYSIHRLMRFLTFAVSKVFYSTRVPQMRDMNDAVKGCPMFDAQSRRLRVYTPVSKTARQRALTRMPRGPERGNVSYRLWLLVYLVSLSRSRRDQLGCSPLKTLGRFYQKGEKERRFVVSFCCDCPLLLYMISERGMGDSGTSSGCRLSSFVPLLLLSNFPGRRGNSYYPIMREL